jgi:hypothetical protein
MSDQQIWRIGTNGSPEGFKAEAASAIVHPTGALVLSDEPSGIGNLVLVMAPGEWLWCYLNGVIRE